MPGEEAVLMQKFLTLLPFAIIGLLVAGGVSKATAVPGDTPYLPALVVCPNSARPAWRQDLKDWTQGIAVVEPQGTEGIAKAIRQAPSVSVTITAIPALTRRKSGSDLGAATALA